MLCYETKIKILCLKNQFLHTTMKSGHPFYLGGFWKQLADDVKTVDIQNLSQDLNDSLKKLIKTAHWDGVTDVVQHTCQ